MDKPIGKLQCECGAWYWENEYPCHEKCNRRGCPDLALEGGNLCEDHQNEQIAAKTARDTIDGEAGAL